MLGIIFTTIYYTNSYYSLSLLSKQPQKCCTVKGNSYSVQENELVENGNYVFAYVCDAELREEWNKRSHLLYDYFDLAEQPISTTIIRYLNSKGFTKDAEGVAKLDTVDIDRIERGVANVYYEEGNIFRKMLYIVLYEYEHYKYYSTVIGHSFFQRLELWKTSFQVIKKNLWFGVGTGDVADAVKMQLEENDSCLKDTSLRTHNQYVTFLLSFGIVGMLIVLFSIFYAPIKAGAFQEVLFLVFFCIISISMLSEDTLETEAGVTFYAFFYTFFISMKKNDAKKRDDVE